MIPLWRNTIHGKLTAFTTCFRHTRGIPSHQMPNSKAGFANKASIIISTFSTKNDKIRQADKTHRRQYSNV